MKLKTLIATAVFATAIFATNAEALAVTADTAYPVSTEDSQIMPLRDETGWYVRVVNGRLQKRLWSYTYGEWLTDWEWV